MKYSQIERHDKDIAEKVQYLW